MLRGMKKQADDSREKLLASVAVLMKANNVTAHEAARQLGIDPVVYDAWVRGERPAPVRPARGRGRVNVVESPTALREAIVSLRGDLALLRTELHECARLLKRRANVAGAYLPHALAAWLASSL